MDCCTRHAIALAVVGLQGCLSGHLLDMARRREQPIVYREAFVDGDRLLLVYTAQVTNDLGEPLARRERRVALALADLRRGDLGVDAFPVARLADGAPLRGQPAALHVGTGGRVGQATPFLEIEEAPDGRHVRFVLHEPRNDPYAPFHSPALTCSRTAAWVYPLLPLSLAVDAAIDPVLLFFAPAVMVLGD